MHERGIKKNRDVSNVFLWQREWVYIRDMLIVCTFAWFLFNAKDSDRRGMLCHILKTKVPQTKIHYHERNRVKT